MQRDKKMLLVGGGYAEIPLIKAAKKLGFQVITTGNAPQQPGHRYADEYAYADYADPDAILAVAQQHRVDAICPSCNDFALLASAFVAQRMGLPGQDDYATAVRLHHKDQYRSFAAENGLPAPHTAAFSQPDDAYRGALEFTPPYIIKPVDLTGGKGIQKISGRMEAQPAIDRAFALSRSKRILLEQYLPGSNHGFSTFIERGKVVFHFADDEHYYLNKYHVCAASTPTTSPPAAIDRLIADSEKIAHRLGLVNGIFHIQYILDAGPPCIVEICRRAPGDLYISFVQQATGVDYPLWIVKTAAGLAVEAPDEAPLKGCFTRHCIMAERNGVVERVHFDPVVRQKMVDQCLWYTRGYRVDDFMTQKLGIVFLRFDSRDEMLDITPRLHRLITVQWRDRP